MMPRFMVSLSRVKTTVQTQVLIEDIEVEALTGADAIEKVQMQLLPDAMWETVDTAVTHTWKQAISGEHEDIEGTGNV